MNGNTSSNPTFLWDVIGDVHIIVCGDRPLTDDEVEMYCTYTAKHIGRIRACFCYTDKELPNQTQRNRLAKMYDTHLKGRKRAAMAVVFPPGSNIILRSMLVALSWINPDSQGFSAKDDQDAFRYLEVSDPSVQGRIWDRVRELRMRLAGGTVPKPASEASTATDHFDRANYATMAHALTYERLIKIRERNAERDRREAEREKRLTLASTPKPGLAKTRPPSELPATKKGGAT